MKKGDPKRRGGEMMGKGQIEFSHQVQKGISIIMPLGDSLDATNALSYKNEVLKLLNSTGETKVIFDLSKLQFIDSSGLGTFISILRSLNGRGGTLKLANLNRPIKTVFEIVSMHRIFDVFPNIEEAIKSF